MSETVTVNCAYPGCERPVAPRPTTGGRSRYCDDPDHNPTSAFHARKRGREHKEPTADGVEHPASTAASSLADTTERLSAVLSEMGQLVEVAGKTLVTATNPESVATELAASRADTERRVAEVEGRLAAEIQRRMDAEEATEAMALQLAAAEEQIARPRPVPGMRASSAAWPKRPRPQRRNGPG